MTVAEPMPPPAHMRRDADAAAAAAQLVHERDDHAGAGARRPGGRASSRCR